METIYVIDTHALIWYLAGDARLGVNAKAILDAPESELVIPSIVVSESLFMVSHGKTEIASEKIWTLLTDFANVTLYPLDLPILKVSEGLTKIVEIHDRIIVATALSLKNDELEPAILTRDTNITESGLVRVIW